MRRALARALLAACLLGLLGAAGAAALKIEIGDTMVSATAEISPRALPAKGNGAARISSIVRIGSHSGAQPPTLQELTFMFDKHGTIAPKGLPTCSLAKLAGTTVAQARQRCRGAIVGTGTGRAMVTLPGQAPIRISSPLTFFNAAPQGGRPSLIAHAYEQVPEPQPLLVPFSVERIRHGRYGYQVKIQVPPIADGYGAATLAEATIGVTWKRGGRSYSYLGAHCSGGRLQVHGKIIFTDGSFFPGTLTSPCHVSG